MTQLDLLTYPNSPGFKSPGTSQEAAEAMRPTAAVLMGKCLQHVGYWPDIGCTADECAEALGESVLAVRPRFSEMLAKGLIFDTGDRRKNRSGRNATVWRVKA